MALNKVSPLNGVTFDNIQPFNDNIDGEVEEIPGSNGEISTISHKQTSNGPPNKVNLCINVQHAKNKFKTKLNYKIYNLMLPTLFLILIVFCFLIWGKGSNAIKMEDLNSEINIKSDDLDKASDAYNLILTNNSIGHDKLIAAESFRNQKQTELDNLKDEYNKKIHIDNYCDKLSDLCNGIIGAILMVYIGSAGYKMTLLKERGDNSIKTCPIPKKNIMERIFNKDYI